jgi:hypothetical protein
VLKRHIAANIAKLPELLSHEQAVLEREDLQLPIRRRRDGGDLPPDGSNGGNGEALLDQGGGQEAVAK